VVMTSKPHGRRAVAVVRRPAAAHAPEPVAADPRPHGGRRLDARSTPIDLLAIILVPL